ncbi:MAG TPA: aminotransferase class I/II-fold pyridoxal phosphate-dependent enzyme [Nitrosopumilaceae archaeon]|nr:aminotransferase class I/II-fold pyridoxal phosphate-dependent enzyme [Nitrosopumilaceae archaeon]
MKHKLDFVNSSLKKTKDRNLHRMLQYSCTKGPYITFKDKKLINLCSNDYLGLVTNSMTNKQLQSSSRLVAGNDSSFKILEEKLAHHKSQKSALIFPTGYMANLGAISTIARKGDVIFSDELNHASIIEACRLSGAKITVYKHNDLIDLERKVKQKQNRNFIVTEGVFSMDGDFANLKEISQIALKNDAILILDDAHGDFVVGEDGKGTGKLFGVEKKIDLYTSSLSKGLGAFGGYVSSTNEVVDFLINNSKSFIYTSALPNILVDLALKRFNSNREKQRKKLWQNIRHMHSGLRSLGYEVNSPSQIIPIIIGNEKFALEFGKYLFKNGIFVQPIRYPTVKINMARMRISITAWLSKNQIEKSLDVLEQAGKKFRIF